MADGSIIINVDLDDKSAQQELNRLTKRIKSLEDSISVSQKKKMPLLEQSKQLAAVLDEAKAKLYEMQQVPKGTFDASEISEQQKRVRSLQTEWNRVQSAVERYDQKINNASIEIDWSKEKAGELASQMSKAGVNAQKMEKATKKANKSMGVFATRLRGILLSAFVFNILSSGMRNFTEWVGKVIKSNTEAQAAIAKLKGALLTLAQPIVSVIVPAFTTLVNILTRVVSTIAQIFAMLTGTSVKSTKEAAKALNEQTEALEGTGAAAEEAAGSLAGFDEINQITTETSKSGSGTETITPDFDFETNLSEDRLKNILGLIEAIGAAFLAWRIGKALGMNLKQIAGLALAVYSAIQFVKSIFDAWTNGVDWSNLRDMLLSAAGLAAGLYLAFGKVGAGIGLIVSGLAMLATGFHDAMENGWNLENLMTTISGIMLAGLGIGVLTGSWIPLLIAGIASIVLALTVATGHGEELLEGVRTMLEGFKDFFTGIFAGDIEKAVGGIEKIFDGLGQALDAIISGVRDSFLSFVNWLEEKTGADLSETTQKITDLFRVLQETVSGIVDGLKDVFSGLVTFISGVLTNNWSKAWEGVKQIFRGVINAIISLAEGMVNGIINGINAIIRGFNKVLALGDGVAEAVFGKTVRINELSRISIPRLAEGAVIPPNREFMAVLGDQTSGNNIEAPESLIRKIVREEAGGMNTELLEAILEAIKAGKVMVMDGKEVARSTVKHINTMTKANGKPVILV